MEYTIDNKNARDIYERSNPISMSIQQLAESYKYVYL